MARAITLAKKGHYTTSPNPRVGCVIVRDDKIIGEGFHIKAGDGHAEVNAIRHAKNNQDTHLNNQDTHTNNRATHSNNQDTHLTKGATAYVTLEPCSHFGKTPPCAQALIDNGIAKVIIAMVDPNPQVSGNGIAMLKTQGIEVLSGLLSQEAQKLNVGFIKKMTTKMPYVRCKLAASLDGKTAMKSGESKWITSKDAREDVQRLRAQSCAVITGCDSVLFDDAKMNVRWNALGELKNDYVESSIRQPVRIIIDSKNRLTPDLAIFNECSPIIIFNASLEKQKQWPHFVKHVVMPTVNNDSDDKYLDLKAVLHYLAENGMNDILLESGASLAGAFIEQNLVDELILYQAPKLMGGDGKSLMTMPHIQVLANAKTLKYSDVRMVGCDIRLTAQLNK